MCHFDRSLEKLCSEYVLYDVKSNMIVCRHYTQAYMFVFAILHHGSWKNDTKHLAGKQPPARTDRFVCISLVTVGFCVHSVYSSVSLHVCEIYGYSYFLFQRQLKLAIEASLFLLLKRNVAFSSNSMHITPISRL